MAKDDKSVQFIAGEAYISIQSETYEVKLDAATGGIVSLYDKKAEEQVSTGNKDTRLWQAKLVNGVMPGSDKAESFSYEWKEAEQQLTLRYGGDIEVDVTISPTNESALFMQADVRNRSGKELELFSFPHELSIAADGIESGFVPLMPGAKLKRSFFDSGGAYRELYPGAMFADYVAAETTGSHLSVYGIRDGVLQPAHLGFRVDRTADGKEVRVIHEYRTWAGGEEDWSSPKVALHVGGSYVETMKAYRTDNRQDEFESLSDKLGDKRQAYYESPMYKLDLHRVGLPFEDLHARVIDRIRIPGMIHPVAFQQRGHDQNYPDFVPPDARWGTAEQFKAFTAYAQANGNLVVPYTNFSWWDLQSRFVDDLTRDELLDVTVRMKVGQPTVERYGPHGGYVANPNDDYVKRTIAEQQRLLAREIGMDGIFEDQWGARNAPYAFNSIESEGDDASTAYFSGVLAHAEANRGNLLLTEVGIDALAEHLIGFMGTNYLWDIHGHRKATSGHTEYFPMMGIIGRDKVLLYQHDLAAETWTASKEMLRWNLAYGYQLSNEITSPAALDQNEWIDLIGVFQKHGLSRYADELVTEFYAVEDGDATVAAAATASDTAIAKATVTEFETFVVHANWNDKAAYGWGDHDISPAGAAFASRDGDVTGGVFTAYNGQPLSRGDHYILETRLPEEVRIYQPIGSETAITIRKPSGIGAPKVTAYSYKGAPIESIAAETDGDSVTFKIAPSLGPVKVYYYSISEG